MRSREELRTVRRLAGDGLGINAISRETGIPSTTVHRWLSGRPPRFRLPASDSCPVFGHPMHHRDALDQEAHGYVLGLYLGDGHVAPFPRTSCLRIYVDARYPEIVAACAETMRRVLPGNRATALSRVG